MNVVIKINGREAIPVRALPFLSDRKTMSPDVVANVFAGKDLLGRFAGLCAYRIENGAVTPIAQRWWQTGPCQKLAALSATLQAEESANETETKDEYKLRHARELAKWRDKSPGVLPAGAFVFKDEFQLIYSNEFEYGHYHFMGDDRKPLSAIQHGERMALDYSPFVDCQTATLIMAGMEELPLAQEQKPGTPAPVVAASDATLDPERRLAALRALGGAAKYKNCEWSFTFITKLVDSEKRAGRTRCDPKTIRSDLREAAQAELDAKRAGYFDGMG